MRPIGVCRIDNCERRIAGQSLCSTHYQRLRNGKDLNAPIQHNRKNGETLHRDANGNKLCIRCNEFLPEDMFQSHAGTSDKKQPYCDPCVSNKRIFTNYGITKSQVTLMLKQQDGCAICHVKEPSGDKNWHVDHDHSCCPGTKTCGKCVRGILCGYCNRAIGQFMDSPERLAAAADYILQRRLDADL